MLASKWSASEPCVSLVNFWFSSDILSCACWGHDYACISSKDINLKATWHWREVVNSEIATILHYSNDVKKKKKKSTSWEEVKVLEHTDLHHILHGLFPWHLNLTERAAQLHPTFETEQFVLLVLHPLMKQTLVFELREATWVCFVALLIIQLELAFLSLSVNEELESWLLKHCFIANCEKSSFHNVVICSTFYNAFSGISSPVIAVFPQQNTIFYRQ